MRMTNRWSLGRRHEENLQLTQEIQYKSFNEMEIKLTQHYTEEMKKRNWQRLLKEREEGRKEGLISMRNINKDKWQRRKDWGTKCGEGWRNRVNAKNMGRSKAKCNWEKMGGGR